MDLWITTIRDAVVNDIRLRLTAARDNVVRPRVMCRRAAVIGEQHRRSAFLACVGGRCSDLHALENIPLFPSSAFFRTTIVFHTLATCTPFRSLYSYTVTIL